MVKPFFLFFFLVVALQATQLQELINKKVQTVLDNKTYMQNKPFIDILLTPPEKFMKQDRVDVVKIVATLKENGLLELFYKQPQKMQYSFTTNGSVLFFVKIMGDALRNIGYYRFVTKSSSYDSNEFSWSVSITSEYAIDPLILQKELQKYGCEIIDISRQNSTKWSYAIDTSRAKLHVKALTASKEVKLKRSLEPYWFDVSQIQRLRIISKGRNRWYPSIAYYDPHLHLIKTVQRDKKSYDITVVIPKNAMYIKIADIYTMKNIKDTLVLQPSGIR
jgi:hypothetical protein